MRLALLALMPFAAMAQTPYLVKPQCMPVLNGPGFYAVNESIRANSVGVCVSWECIPETYVPGDPFKVVTYCGTWAIYALSSARVDTIRKALDPLLSLQNAGKRYTIVPLSDPSMAGMPK